jgi:tRNA modification GTPase
MEDTIAAIATPFGEGGIGIIRISGERSKDILYQIFVPAYGDKETPIENRRFNYGHILSLNHEQVIDEVLCVYMKAPSTYTREDIVEIHCHGSVVSLRRTLSLVLNCGARLAEPGEFTKRAFLNGRIDLSQAEAVIDVIKAKTEKSFEVAMNQMEGHLSRTIRDLRKALMDLLVQLAVNIDYSEEDIEELTYDEIIKCISTIGDKVQDLLNTETSGRMLRDGLKVTIVGKPNVGKSSLLNALLKEARAIVTAIPGTTRDPIEEVLSIEGIPVLITDTAGIHTTEDYIEQIGIEKTKAAISRADLIIFMVDGSEPLREEDYAIAEQIGDRGVIILLNKRDLGKRVSEEQLIQRLPQAVFIDTSILEQKGVKELEDQIVAMVYGGEVSQEQSDVVTSARQQDLLSKAQSDLLDALKMATKQEAMDFIEVDVRHAWELLGDIIGETVTEDIINQVFERFCLGK